MLDHVSSSIDSQLDYQKKNQSFISGNNNESYEYNNRDPDVVDSNRDTQNISSATFLSDSISGSPKHRKKCAINGLHLVIQKGKPHLFTTMTVQ
jgi:c-di-GMP-related signal transduction protein